MRDAVERDRHAVDETTTVSSTGSWFVTRVSV